MNKRKIMELRILVVDDEKSVLNMVLDALSELECSLSGAETVEKAIELMDEHEFDLIITDKNMPDPEGDSAEGGMSILRLVKKRSPKIEVIMITGYASIETAVEALRLGAFDYLSKPFEIVDLINKVQRLIEFHGFINPRNIIDTYKSFREEILSLVQIRDDEKLKLLADNIDYFLRTQRSLERALLEQRETLASIAGFAEQLKELRLSDTLANALIGRICKAAAQRL